MGTVGERGGEEGEGAGADAGAGDAMVVSAAESQRRQLLCDVVYAFPEVRPNRTVAREGDVLATGILEADARSPDAIRTRLNLLLASAFAEMQRRGSLTEGLQFDANALGQLAQALGDDPQVRVTLQVIAARTSDSADPVFVSIRVAR